MNYSTIDDADAITRHCDVCIIIPPETADDQDIRQEFYSVLRTLGLTCEEYLAQASGLTVVVVTASFESLARAAEDRCLILPHNLSRAVSDV